MNKLLVVILLAICSFSLFAEESEFKNLPNWLGEEIVKFRQGKSFPVTVTEYLYNGKNVFVVSANICCDLGATMYSEEGQKICVLIGFSGSWEEKCNEFPRAGKWLRTIDETK